MPGTDTPKLFPDVFKNNKIKVCGDVLQFTLDKSHYISIEQRNKAGKLEVKKETQLQKIGS